jgi:hypothetical protein
VEEVVFSQYTVDLVKTSLEYCALVENASNREKTVFIDQLRKILPLLYLNVSLIPEIEEFYDSELENKVSEEMYMHVTNGIADLLGEDDLYLETFHPDIHLSDTPVAVKLSEDLADIYQDLGNFIGVFKNGHKETMNDSLVLCIRNFEEYWGQKSVNALRALHYLKYNLED